MKDKNIWINLDGRGGAEELPGIKRGETVTQI